MNSYWKAASLGMIAGMRSMSAPALISDYLVKHPSLFLEASPLRGIALPMTARALRLIAIGELGVDKLPGVPNRTAPGPLGARAVSGAICGAAVFLAEGERAEVGAVVGAAAAIASAFLFYTLRRDLGTAAKIPDAAIAVAEDAILLGIGTRVFAGG